MAPPQRARLFLGSSAEGRDVARHLQVELGAVCDVDRWDQNVFEPGGYTLDSLIEKASVVDFAILVASPDDTTRSRGEEAPSARDNVVLEYGLFAGVLGRQRTYLLATGELKLPSDLLGITRLTFKSGSPVREAVTAAALQVEERVRSLGPRQERASLDRAADAQAILDAEIDQLCNNALSQGWVVKTNSSTTLRLRSPNGAKYTLVKGKPSQTRAELRRFANEVRASGLRVNSSLRRRPDESPFE